MRKAIVFGAGGFIGNHLVKRLKSDGFWVRGVDLKFPEFSKSLADQFIIGDLRNKKVVNDVIDDSFEELYQLAADMGGAGYLFSGENDANVMHNSALINLHTAELACLYKVKKMFYSSSACIYPKYNQEDPANPNCEEESAYPADPDSEYGWEKLFSERLYQAFAKNFALNIKIGRFHNIYGPEGPWNGGKEKAPAAICRKVAEAQDGGAIEIWGDGSQSRSFLYIEDCLDAVRVLMDSQYSGPFNIGSEELISIGDFARMIIRISEKKLSVKTIEGPVGVKGRTSDNKLIGERLGWSPNVSLEKGIRLTYIWISRKANLVNQNEPV